MASSLIEVKQTEDKGRGIFAVCDINQGELIEESHCLSFTKEEYENYCKFTVLEHYLFKRKNGGYFLALGLGSIFNHNKIPNTDYRLDEENQVIRYYTSKPIMKGEQLYIFYGTKLWFDTGEDSSSPLSSDDESTLFQNLDI